MKRGVLNGSNLVQAAYFTFASYCILLEDSRLQMELFVGCFDVSLCTLLTAASVDAKPRFKLVIRIRRYIRFVRMYELLTRAVRKIDHLPRSTVPFQLVVDKNTIIMHYNLGLNDIRYYLLGRP